MSPRKPRNMRENGLPHGTRRTRRDTFPADFKRESILRRDSLSTAAGTSNDAELEKVKKRLQFVVYCIDCFAHTL
jgi:hypothetical protein